MSLTQKISKNKKLATLLLFIFALDWYLPLHAQFEFNKTYRSYLRTEKQLLHVVDNTSINMINQRLSNIVELNLSEQYVENLEELEKLSIYASATDIDIDLGGGGPISPEYSKFESVSTDDMVDPFTGDFNYNLPVLEVPGAHDGGYAVSLSYQSGNSPEDDASWVGYGWNLNPGAITRLKKGLPDDIDNEEIEYINDVPKNWTTALTPSIGAEAYTIKADLGITLKYNNYKGFGGGFNAGISIVKGLASLTYNLEDGEGSFRPHINPAGILAFRQYRNQRKMHKEYMKYSDILKDNISSLNHRETIDFSDGPCNPKLVREKINKKLSFSVEKTKNMFNSKIVGSLCSPLNSSLIVGDINLPMNVSPFTGTSITNAFEAEIDPALVIVGLTGGFTATYTEQISQSKTSRNACGYLYSHNAEQNNTTYSSNSSQNSIMDYNVEKDDMFNKRDHMMPVPVAAADYFTVSGEGIGGAFRAYSNKPGIFMPPKTESYLQMVNMGGELHFGTDLGFGVSGAYGEQYTKVLPNWKDNGNTNNYQFKINTIPVYGSQSIQEDEPYIFRMNNDLGGNLIADPSPLNKSLSVANTPLIIGGFQLFDLPFAAQPNIVAPTKHLSNFNGTKRSGRATHVVCHTNNQMLSGKPNSRFESDAAVNSYINRAANVQSHIGEVGITKTDGSQYVYGLPVYNRFESSMHYNITPSDLNGIPSANNVYGDYIVHAKINGNEAHVGEEQKYGYPSGFLLTSIRSAEYEDINQNNELDEQDLGGYTKFKYTRIYGSDNKYDLSASWLHWRSPYTGLFLDQTALHKRNDDMGGYSSGEKEQYYLNAIETKTHIAVFVTNQSVGYTPNGSTSILPNTAGSNDVRFDAMDAGSNFAAAFDPMLTGSNRLRKLEKIMLFAKPVKTGEPYKLLKTVKFKYDYSTWPNCKASKDLNGNRTGKLTLKKVWVEYQDVKSAHVSPYVFEYEYPNYSTCDYTNKYSTIKEHYNISSNVQKPDYEDNLIGGLVTDRWGNYGYNCKTRKLELNHYVPQNVPAGSFDPAAWQLKQIKLPTGGEIHVQYEQDNYTDVQNRRATVMVSFKSQTAENQNRYVLNTSDLGPNVDAQAYAKLLNNYFNSATNSAFNKKDGNRIYFKFLYDLTGNANLNLPLNSTSCKSEYLDGYVTFHSATVNGNGDVEISVADGNPPSIPGIDGWFSNTTNYKYPKVVCYDYVKTETGWQAGSCSVNGTPIETDMSTGGPLKSGEAALMLWNKMKNKLSAIITGGGSICAEISNSHSYFKLPIMPSEDRPGKIGGGLRVKRILMFNKGIESTGNDLSLYGTEFSYVKENGWESSGVATNEPNEGYDENAIVHYLVKRDPQSTWNRLISGKDKDQFEGPYGESFLPTPSVGYERVVMNNIHSGKTGAGFAVNTYYTCKSYPFDADGNFSNDDVLMEKFYLPIPAIILSIDVSKHWAVQNYTFKKNSMHGLLSTETKYAGVYNGQLDPTKNPKVYAKYSTYYQPGEKVPVVSSIFDTPVLEELGTESELYFERRCVDDFSWNGGLSTDFASSLTWPPVISFGALPYGSLHRSRLSTMVSTKSITYPAILKQSVEVKDDLISTNSVVALDRNTGQVMIAKNSETYTNSNKTLPLALNNHIYTYAQTAANVYADMGQRAVTENKKFVTSGSVQSSAGNYKLLLSVIPSDVQFSVGDLLGLSNCTGSSVTTNYFYITSIVPDPGNSSSLLIGVEKMNSTQNATSFNLVEIVKSGRSNQLSESSGSITTLNAMNVQTSPGNQATLGMANTLCASMNASSMSSSNLATKALNVSPYANPANSQFFIALKDRKCMSCNCTSSNGVPVICDIRLKTWIDPLSNDLFLGLISSSHNIVAISGSNGWQAPIIVGTPVVNDPTITLTPSSNNVCNSQYLLLSLQKLGKSGGVFYADPNLSNGIMYLSGSNVTTAVNVFEFCEKMTSSRLIANVLSNDATTYRNTWDYSTLSDFASIIAGSPNSINSNKNASWLPFQNYVYKKDRTSANNGTNKIYSAGTYVLKINNFSNPVADENWILASNVDYYTPYGEPVQETDALGISSSGRYLSDKTMPNVVANNADYNSVSFENFEYLSAINSPLSLNVKAKHSGTSCVKLPGGNSCFYKHDIVLTPQVLINGLIVKFWASNLPEFIDNVNTSNSTLPIDNIAIKCTLNTTLGNNNLIGIATRVSRSGFWSLYEIKFDFNSLANLSTFYNTTAGIKITNEASSDGITYSSTKDLFLDDVRSQPTNSSMSCFVYDATSRRLLATFGDSHYGLYYLYTPEGKLMRKLVETEKGIRMIDETQYNSANQMTRDIN